MVELKGLDKKSKREIGKIMSLLEDVNFLRNQTISVPDDEFIELTSQFRMRYKQGETLDSLMAEAFAMAREACKRSVKMYPYDVQVLGGILLYKGCIAEMGTGEGKTLTAVLPAYLMSLTGQGVHIVTVNDYLAKTGAEDNRGVYELLGLTVGCVQSGMTADERRRQYACDVTYVTNSELGFDYLRDSRTLYKKDRVLRGFNYAIIDEADSVLIDEARTPLIISGTAKNDAEFFRQTDRLVKTLVRGEAGEELSKRDILSGVETEETGDYVVLEKEKTVHLTERGVRKIEKMLGIKNYSTPKHSLLRYHVQAALKAYGLMKKDRDYIVRNGEVIVVNEFTGRLAEGQRYRDGLHQALEAKEGVAIQQGSNTLASITYQNLFNKYEKKSGMTGTAMTSAKEFAEIYGLKVVAVPPNKTMRRQDMADTVYLTKQAKLDAVVRCVKNIHRKGRPVLVGTASIADSEYLSRLLSEDGIRHVVLNAKYYEKEAVVIAKAGQVGSVVIATNMAGRGTDIKLSPEARSLGGLFVIGTERHEARRIDNQLRGRAGRQGDPGTTRYFISLEDDLMRLFGSEKAISVLKAAGVHEEDPIRHRGISSMIAAAQKRIESVNFGLRRTLMDFDSSLTEQKELVMTQRLNIVEGENTSLLIENMIRETAIGLVNKYYPGNRCKSKLGFMSEWDRVFHRKVKFCSKRDKMLDVAATSARVYLKSARQQYDNLLDVYDAQKRALIGGIDVCWARHLDTLERLRQAFTFAVGRRQDVVTEYRNKSYLAFEKMLSGIQKETVRIFFENCSVQSGFDVL